jgi:hypothetical protein
MLTIWFKDKHELFTARLPQILRANVSRTLPRSTLRSHDVTDSALSDMIVQYGQADLRHLDQLCQIIRKVTSSLNPTFTWSYPTSVKGVAVQIYDKSSLINGHVNVVFYRPLPGAMNSFTLPTVLAGGFTLTPGTSYVVDLKGLVLPCPT